MACDKDNSKEVSREELISECSRIHCGYVLQKLKIAIENAKSHTVESVFKAVDNNGNGQMEVTEFNEMIRLLYDTVDKYEVDALFKHFDTKGCGRITLEEFKKALKMPVSLENRLQFSLHDFMTPLKTKLQKCQIRPEAIFDKFS